MSDDYITLDTNFSIQSGFAFPSSAFVDEGIPIVRMSDLKTGSLKFENTKYVSSNWLDIASLFRLKEGDFVLGMSGSLSNYAKVTINDVPALLNQRVGRLVSKNLSNSYEYASYWLKSEFYQHYADIQGEGAAQKNISPKKIGAFKIRDVDKPIQDKIVSFLATIDQTIEKTEALIAKYQLIKAGLMQDLFTRGIGADGKLRPTREQAPELYQETQIGWIPKDWELKTCGETFDIDSGITLGLHRRPKNNARPYLRVANVYKEKIRMDDISYLEADAQENERYALKTHDLLIVEGHANIQQIGRCAIVNNNAEGMLFQNHLFRLKAKDTSSYFGMYMLNSYIARKYWERNCSTSSGLNTINKTMLRKMPILVPSQNEQEAIVEKINTIVNKTDNERRLFHKLNSQKQGLMHDLLTGKKRVTVNECEADHV